MDVGIFELALDRKTVHMNVVADRQAIVDQPPSRTNMYRILVMSPWADYSLDNAMIVAFLTRLQLIVGWLSILDLLTTS